MVQIPVMIAPPAIPAKGTARLIATSAALAV